MANPESLLKRRAAQVEVAIFEALVLAGVDRVSDFEGRRLALVHDAGFDDVDLDISGREFCVLVATATFYDSADRDNPFVTHGSCDVMRGSREIAVTGEFGIEHELGDAFTVAQVHEYAAPVVSIVRNPAEEDHNGAFVRGAEFSAMMRAFQFIDESGHEGRHSTAPRASPKHPTRVRPNCRAQERWADVSRLAPRYRQFRACRSARPSSHFPSPEQSEDGLLALGGDLSPERLLLAYRSGIFPWYAEGMPILWHSPDPRCVLQVDRIHVGRTLRRMIAKRPYDISFDRAFRSVIAACQLTPRHGQDGTWITDEMVGAYVELHRLGYAHSVEAWSEGELVGGLYGVSLGAMFFGESMFSWRPSASKIALIALASLLRGWGFRLIDAQVANDNTLSMGAEQWPRDMFLRTLREALMLPTRRGTWSEQTPELEPCAP